MSANQTSGESAASELAEVLDDPDELLDLDPARAELWVSGLLADFGQGPVVEAISALAAPTPAQALVGAVLSVVAEAPSAEQAAARFSPEQLASPAWAAHLGTAAPVDAMRVLAGGEHMTTIIRFEHGDESRHLVLVDLGTDPVRALDIRFAPDGLFEESFDDPELELEPATIAEVAAEFVDAIENPAFDEPSIELNLLVARRRAEAVLRRQGDARRLLPLEPTEFAPAAADAESVDVFGHRDVGADAAAVEALEAALGKWFVADSPLAPTPTDVAETAARLRALADSPEASANYRVVLEAAGLTGDEPDEQLVLGCCGAYVMPVSLSAFEPTEVEAIRHLEWADWFGAVAVLVRKGPGTVVTPREMVKAINRCPEVTTTIPKADADYVAWSFERTLHAWELSGVLSPDGELTEFGQRVLPYALRHRWGGAPQAGDG